MPGQERLTDRNILTAAAASNNLKFYVVDEDKTTEHPDGDSFQVSKSELIEILGIENSSTGQRLKKVIAIVDNTATPPTEVNGDRYILDNTGSSHANWDGASAWDVVEFNGTNWVNTTPEEGMVAYVDDEDKDAIFVDDGTPAWELVASSDQDNIPIVKGFEADSSAFLDLVAGIDALPTYTVTEKQIVFFQTSIIDENDVLNTAIITLAMRYKGKGTYGVGGDSLLGNLWIVGTRRLAYGDAEIQPNTQIINLGSHTSTTVEAVFNAQSEFTVQAKTDGLRLVNITLDAVEKQYFFTGVGGDYGTGGDLTATADQFDEITGEEPVVSPITTETTLPANGIVIDGTKRYEITSGIIKVADSGHTNYTDVEIVSNPTDAASLVIDLRNFPNSQLQGGGFSESPSGVYTLETDLADDLLKQHLTLLMWRRNNLYASNSMNYLPNGNPSITGVTNSVDNTYVTVTFNTAILASDLVIGNFSKTFTQNGGTATNVTLDSVTDNEGSAISVGVDEIRIYYTVTGTPDGNEYFTVTAASLTDLYTHNSTNETSENISLIGGDPISALANVIAYWKEGEGDNDSGTATKTDIKNSKVLTAANEANPTLNGSTWEFDGTDDGFEISDSAINDLINADAKDFQIHFIGSWEDTSSSRIISANEIDTFSSSWNFVYKSGAGDLLFNCSDNVPDSVSQDIGVNAVISTTYLISIKYYQSSGNKVDIYIDNGSTIENYLNLDASTLNVSEVDKLFIGMRETGSTKSYYNINFKSLVIANSSDDFDTIRTELAL